QTVAPFLRGLPMPPEEVAARCVVGTPEECVGKLWEFVEAGCVKFVLRPACPLTEIMSRIELYGKEILPHFGREEGRKDYGRSQRAYCAYLWPGGETLCRRRRVATGKNSAKAGGAEPAATAPRGYPAAAGRARRLFRAPRPPRPGL